jgi:steroid 5-alpha reductase family enzyme
MINILATLALYGLALELYLMTLTWVFAWRLKNAGLVDPVWAFGFIPLLGLYILLSGAGTLRLWVFAVAVTAWSARLSFHLFRRWWNEYPTEDGRYAKLRAQWGKSAEPKMWGFFIFQAVASTLLTLPWLAVVCHPSEVLTVLEWVGVVVIAVGIAGETVADSQLTRFRRAGGSGRILDTGLWKYSRHPNYFFEFLTWCGFAVYASASPYGYTAWIAAALMGVFLLKFTGVPATEAAMKEKRGEEYDRYLRKTSPFVPLPPRR